MPASNFGDIQTYVTEQLSNDPRTYEKPTILVLNATDVAGLASDERAKLVNDGYQFVDTDNAPEYDYDTGYTLYIISNKPGTRSMLVGRYEVEIEIPEVIPRTHDFVIIVNPETETEAKTESE